MMFPAALRRLLSAAKVRQTLSSNDNNSTDARKSVQLLFIFFGETVPNIPS